MDYKVRITVKEVTKGECPVGHVPGQSWLIEGSETPTGMCSTAYTALAPFITAFRFGGTPSYFEGREDKDVQVLSCIDPKRWVIFELRRFKES